MKKRISELDYVRAFLCLAVIMIHASSIGTIYKKQSDLEFYFDLFINKGSNFAVPCFIMLSGFVLFYRYEHATFDLSTTWGFYKKRFVEIVIPFFVFSILYTLFNYTFTSHPSWIGAFQYLMDPDILNNIWIGKAYTHLYYFLIIMQFYVFLPLLVGITKHVKHKEWFMLLLGFLIQFGFIVIYYNFRVIERVGTYSFSYFFFFMIGGVLALKYEDLLQILTKKLKVIRYTSLSLLLTLITLMTTFQFYTVRFETRIYSPVISQLIYTLFIITAFVFVYSISYGQTSKFNHIGQLSFGIYLIHPFFLKLLRVFWMPTLSLPITLEILLTFGLAFSASYLTMIFWTKLKDVIHA